MINAPTAREAMRRVASMLRKRGGATLVLVLLLLTGCGYTQREMFPEQYQTVAVTIFENRTPYRHVETELSEALIKEIERRTPYKTAPPAVADTMLQGAVIAVDQTELSRRPRGGTPEELEVSITVDFEWRNRDGELLRQRPGFEAVGRYAPARPVGEPFETARHTAVERMAEAIVSEMRADW